MRVCRSNLSRGFSRLTSWQRSLLGHRPEHQHRERESEREKEVTIHFFPRGGSEQGRSRNRRADYSETTASSPAPLPLELHGWRLPHVCTPNNSGRSGSGRRTRLQVCIDTSESSHTIDLRATRVAYSSSHRITFIQEVREGTSQLFSGDSSGGLSRNDHDVLPGPGFARCIPEPLADLTLEAVADDRIPNTSVYCQPEPSARALTIG